MLLKKDDVIDIKLRCSGDMQNVNMRNNERVVDSFATDFSDNCLKSKNLGRNNRGSPSSPTLRMSKTIVVSNYVS